MRCVSSNPSTLTLPARKEELERIDQVLLSEDVSRVIAVQGGISTLLAQSSTDQSQWRVPGCRTCGRLHH